ncbi:hypothetical protein [Cyanobium sp. ATX 6F1]|uniref:hypothetical protein n=1 Tax=Cyanobium sp. ATX 6F1 TaxID=2823702 RepID=UPI0020CC4439|nr:hypothetical protein [Cyanobium sp. ATX 6F1]
MSPRPHPLRPPKTAKTVARNTRPCQAFPTRLRWPLFATSFSAALVPLLAAPGLAMTSPWWEDYAIKTRYLCRGEGVLVVERNDAQASIISGRFRTTLFRESSDLAGLRYKTSEGMRLILNGDELTIEQLPQRVQCLRTEEV